VQIGYIDGNLSKIELCFSAKIYKLIGSAKDKLSLLACPSGKTTSSLAKGAGEFWTKAFGLMPFPFIQDDFKGDCKICFEVKILLDNPNEKLLRDTGPTLVEAMQNLCCNEEMSDFKIKCESQEFPCHKLILSTRSDVFKAMFLSDLKVTEDDDNILEIPNISAKIMKTFLKFLYQDEITPEEISCDLLIAADQYNFKRLVNICLKHLEDSIDPTNVMEIAATAYLLNQDQLLKSASKFIFNNRGKVKKGDKWDQI